MKKENFEKGKKRLNLEKKVITNLNHKEMEMIKGGISNNSSQDSIVDKENSLSITITVSVTVTVTWTWTYAK